MGRRKPSYEELELRCNEAEAALCAQQEAYRHLAQNTEAILWEYDIQKDNWPYVSPQAEHILGYAPDKWTTLEFWEKNLHPEDRDNFIEAFREMISSGTPIEVKCRMLHPDKSTHWIHTRAKRILSNDKKSGRILGVTIDITEKHKALQAFENISELSSAMICTISIKTNTFTYVNPAFKSILGYEDEELLGHLYMNFIHPDDLEKTLSVARDLLQTGKELFAFENRYRHKDGSYRQLVWNTKVVTEEDSVYATAIDISEIKKARKRINDIISHSRELFYIHDVNGILTYISEQCWDFFKVSPEEMAKHWTEHITDGSFGIFMDRPLSCPG